MGTEHPSSSDWQDHQALNELFEAEMPETPSVDRERRIDPTYKTTERVFRLLHLLTLHECTREEVFERLKDFYHPGEYDAPATYASSKRTGRMFLRDIRFLQKMGYRIQVTRKGRTPLRYRLEKGMGPDTLFLFNEREMDVLCLLHTLFADPTRYGQADWAQPLPPSPPRNPYAEDILALIERLAAALPPEQKRFFERWTGKPFLYFNMNPVTDYLPHRATIQTIIRAISRRQQISFAYSSTYRLEGTNPHERVDPYYIVYQEGHLLLRDNNLVRWRQ